MSRDDILGFGLVRSYDVEFTFDPRGKRDPLKNFKQGKEKDRFTQGNIVLNIGRIDYRKEQTKKIMLVRRECW